MKKIFFPLLVLLLAACEKPYEADGEEKPADGANVILRMTQFEQIAFSRASTDITELCSRLNVAVFSSDGTKIQSVAQKEGDASFG